MPRPRRGRGIVQPKKNPHTKLCAGWHAGACRVRMLRRERLPAEADHAGHADAEERERGRCRNTVAFDRPECFIDGDVAVETHSELIARNEACSGEQRRIERRADGNGLAADQVVVPEERDRCGTAECRVVHRTVLERQKTDCAREGVVDATESGCSDGAVALQEAAADDCVHLPIDTRERCAQFAVAEDRRDAGDGAGERVRHGRVCRCGGHALGRAVVVENDACRCC